jgi:hypothetical protein
LIASVSRPIPSRSNAVGRAERGGQPEPVVSEGVQTLLRGLAVEVTHFRAGTEFIALARGDNHAHCVVCANVVQRGQVLAEQRTRQPIPRLGAIESTHQHRTVPLGHHVAHDATIPSR